MGRICRPMDEERLLAWIAYERVRHRERAAEEAAHVAQRDLGSRRSRAEPLGPDREHERQREQEAVRKPLPVEHAPVLAMCHEAAQGRGAAAREQLRRREGVLVQADRGEATGARHEGPRGVAGDDALDERAAVRLHEGCHGVFQARTARAARPRCSASGSVGSRHRTRGQRGPACDRCRGVPSRVSVTSGAAWSRRPHPPPSDRPGLDGREHAALDPESDEDDRE
jgi:hypothetical protein